MGLKKWDPRVYILIFLLSFVFMGQLFLGFFQRWDVIIAAVVTAMVTELLLYRLVNKKWIFPLSALISGLGISLILSSYLIWPYILAALLAIGVKYIIRIGGSHLFNPNNVAVVIVLVFLSEYVVSTPKQWTNDIVVISIIVVLGLAAAAAAKRLDTVIAFICGYVIFALLRHGFIGEPLYYSLGPMLGASFQLFVFFMLTDPKTTASKSSIRVLSAVLVAAVDAYLRIHEITNSLFYAAFIITVVFAAPYRYITYRRRKLESLS